MGHLMPLGGQGLDKYVNPTVTITIIHPAKLDRRPKLIEIAPSFDLDFDKRMLIAIDGALKNREESGFPIKVQSASDIGKNTSLMEKPVEQASQALPLEKKDFAVLISVNPKEVYVIQETLLGSKIDKGVSIFDQFKKVVRWTQSVISPPSTQERIFFNLRATNIHSGQILINKNFNSLLDDAPFSPADTQAASTLSEIQIRTLSDALISLLMGWQERVPFLYYDDRNYGMLLAHKLISVEDYAGAAAQSLLNLEEGKKDPRATPKNLAKLHYNLAISLLSTQDFKGATAQLREAVRIDPSSNLYLETLAKTIRYEKYAN